MLAGTAAAPLILILKLVSSSRRVYTLYSFQRLQNFTEYMSTADFRHNVLKLLSTGSNLIYMIGSIAHTK